VTVLKRIALWSLISVLLTINLISLSPEWMERIMDMRTPKKALFPTSRSDCGDLYALSYLKRFGKKGWQAAVVEDTCRAAKNIDLYTINDSYLQNHLEASSLCGVSKVMQSDWNGPSPTVGLDPRKVNILVIETVERYARVRFNNLDWMKHYSISEFELPIVKDGAFENPKTDIEFPIKLFNPHINQNIEFNLFDYRALSPLYEARASLTLDLFNRVAPGVKIVGNGQYLALSETVGGGGSTASNHPIYDQELFQLVKNLNEVRDFYLQKGFSEVYLSIVPNPVHIVDTSFSYNQLIPKIQKYPVLKMPVLDVYSVFKQNNTKVFPRNETHWTNVGLQLWIDRVNGQLKNKGAK
jgi:hypothetical protein